MLRLDKMKEGLFEGYYQTLKYFAENYVEIGEKLRRGGLCLIPRTEIFKLVTKSSVVRERAERASLPRRLSSAVSTLFMKVDPHPSKPHAFTKTDEQGGAKNGSTNGVQHRASSQQPPPAGRE
jgi:hypothetical protein